MLSEAEERHDEGTLCCLTEAPSVGQKYRMNVIAVPDLGGRPAAAWQTGKDSLLRQIIPTLISDPLILEFRYEDGNETYRDFQWDRLLKKSDALLSQLLDWATDPEFLRRPLVFISHGLGGFIVKKTITKMANYDGNPRLRDMFSWLRGMVFLGSPHTPLDKAEGPHKLSLILRACSGISTKLATKCQASIPTMLRVCNDFQGAMAETTTVLSAFETQSTKIRRRFFMSSHEILVDKSLAEIGCRNEVLIGTSASHASICDISESSDLLFELTSFFSGIEKTWNPSTLSGPRSIFSGGTWTSTEAGKSRGAPLKKNDSLDATAGSPDVYNYEIVPKQSSQPQFAGRPPALNLPCHMFRPHVKNPGFFGREKLLRTLDDVLLPDEEEGCTDEADDAHSSADSLKTFALCGPGGIGKTQTAIEFAVSRKDHFDVIAVIQAADSAKLATSFSSLSVGLGLEDEGSQLDQVVSRDLVLEWLCNPTRRRGQREAIPGPDGHISWLLIFDNADNLEHLIEYWPVASRGSILITSRDPLAHSNSYVPSPKGIDMDPFSTSEAATLLQDLTGHNSSQTDIDDCHALADQLSGLPLAVTQAAATMIRRDLSVQEFLDMLKETSSRQKIYNSTIKNHQSSTYDKTVFSVWAIDDLSPSASRVLEFVSFMDPDQIEERLITNYQELIERGDNLVSLPDFPSSLAAYLEVRTELIRPSLIKRNAHFTDLSTHRLIQDVVQLHMDTQRWGENFCGAIEALYAAWPFGINDYSTERWKICEGIFPHIHSLLKHYQSSGQSHDLGNMAERFGHLLSDAGWYYLERGNTLNSLPFQEVAHKVLLDVNPPDKIRLSEVQQAQAEIHIYTGNVEQGLLHAEDSLKLCQDAEKEGKEPGHRLPQAYNEVAEALCNLSRYDEAIGRCDTATSLYLSQEGYDAHFESATFAMVNKAFCLWRLKRLEEAVGLLEKLLEKRKDMYGPDDTSSFKTGLALLTLGNVRHTQGDANESNQLRLRALAQYKTTLGTRHYRVAGVQFTLGDAAFEDGRFPEASILLQESAKIFGERSYFLPELTRTLLRQVDVAEASGGEGLDECKRLAQEKLSELEEKVGKSLSKDDVFNMVQYWAL